MIPGAKTNLFCNHPVSLRWPFPKMGWKGPHRRRSLGRPTFGPNLRKARQVMNNTDVDDFLDESIAY